MATLEQLEKNIGYTFKDKSLLELALRHSSYVYENKMSRLNCNERLEFLGDAVLELGVSKFLYEKFQDSNEGTLTKLRAALVCESALVKDAEGIGLKDFIMLGAGEEATDGRNKSSIISDAMEALLGAVYLDGGIATAAAFVRRHVLTSYTEKLEVLDYKTALQELTQARFGSIPEYITTSSGPDHNKVFKACVKPSGALKFEGKGSSKKEAEQSAASAALAFLKDN